MLAFIAGMSAMPAVSAYAQEAIYDFSIAPGAAADVVRAVGETADVAILYRYEDLVGVRSEGVRGRYTVERALGLALAGAGLVGVPTEAGVLTVKRIPPAAAPPPAAPSPGVVAQGQPGAARPPAVPAPQDRVVITGTRITRPGTVTPVPVTAVSRAEMQRLSPSTIFDAVDQLPQFVNNSSPEAIIGASGSAGQSFLNLRGIGSNRTLVLLDGRRVVASTRRGTTDIGLLPEPLIERVEIVTGGASAAYGSDAVAGVVNFILDTDFTGLAGHMQAGESERGDYGNYEFSLSTGFEVGRAHVLLAADGYGNDGVPNFLDREWHQSWGTIRNADPAGPTLLISPNVYSSAYSFGGLIPRGPLAGTQFLPGGAAAPFDFGRNRTASLQIGGDGVDPARERTVSPVAERQTGFGHLSYEAAPWLNAYVQGLYGHTRVEFNKDPSYMQGNWEATIFIDNPYLPADVVARMQAAGVTSFPFARYASRRDLSVGRIVTDNETVSLTAGMDGTLGGYRLNAYYQFGSNRQNLGYRDTVRVDRVYQAMDAVRDPASGAIVCRSTLSFPDNGCVPTSFFGDGAVSQEAKAWILDDNTQVQLLAQHFLEATIDGELFAVPAGSVQAALGLSYRYEDFKQFTTPYTLAHRTPTAAAAGYQGLPAFYSNGYPVVERAVTNPSRGTAEVGELFAEAIVPLAANLPFVRSLDLQASGRYANYLDSGVIWAWKAGLEWTLDDQLSLRGTVSRDVRGGTLSERFDRAGGGVTARDPFLEGAPAYSFAEFQNGNPFVRPERADTFTAGFVLQPRLLPGLYVSADYYDVRINDAISRSSAQGIIDACYAGLTAFCSLITRSSTGFITTVDNTFLNLDIARTAGVDVDASYTLPLRLFGGAESIELRGIAAIYTRASIKPFGLPRDDYVGEAGPGPGVPDYRLLTSLTYVRDALSVNVTGQYISGGDYNREFVEGVNIADNSVDSAWYMNARVGYVLETAPGPVELYVNVRNMFDIDPPIAPNSGGGFFGTQHAPLDYDQIGRRFTAGVSFRF